MSCAATRRIRYDEREKKKRSPWPRPNRCALTVSRGAPVRRREHRRAYCHGVAAPCGPQSAAAPARRPGRIVFGFLRVPAAKALLRGLPAPGHCASAYRRRSFGMRTPTFNFDVNYCDFCSEENGGVPLCVLNCPTEALLCPRRRHAREHHHGQGRDRPIPMPRIPRDGLLLLLRRLPVRGDRDARRPPVYHRRQMQRLWRMRKRVRVAEGRIHRGGAQPSAPLS